MTKKLIIALLPLALMLCGGDARAQNSPYKQIQLHFDQDGNLQQLHIMTRDTPPINCVFRDGGVVSGPNRCAVDPAYPTPSPDDSLWSGSNVMEFLKGSYCINIGGHRYCTG